MTNFIALIVLLTVLMVDISIAGPPLDGTVNEWVTLALSTSTEDLTKKHGKKTCFGTQGQAVYARNTPEAHAKAVLLCIKYQCRQIQDDVNREVDNLRNQTNSEIKDLLAALGEEEALDSVLSILKGGGYGGTTNCHNNQVARNLSYDMCVMRPYQCQ